MKTQKPERPSCSNLTDRQWKNILDQFEYEWDLERGYYQGLERANRLSTEHCHDVATLSVLSLICPHEVSILEKYDTDCRVEYIEDMEKFKKALIERGVISNDNESR